MPISKRWCWSSSRSWRHVTYQKYPKVAFSLNPQAFLGLIIDQLVWRGCWKTIHSTDSDSESGEPIPPNTGASAPAETGAPNAGASNTGASAPGPTLENINPPDVPTALSVAPSKPAEHAPAQVIEAPAPAPTSISQSLQPASVVAKTGEHGNFGCVVFSIFDYLPCFPGYRLARFLLGFWFINAGCSHQTCRHCCRDGWCCKHSTGYSLEGDRESPRATENAPGPWNLGLFFRPLKLKPWKIIEP